jgi:hypothetical protein
MKVVVFSGPSLPPHALPLLSGLEWRPPARWGDFERVVHQRADAIALIDGTFETNLSVWHREILLALDNGIDVYGAASIGALRAVELADQGMRGIGKVYEAFLTGTLEDDDEVAVLHGPAEVDFLPVTDAMVNIRATLDVAVSRAILKSRTAALLADAAKVLFFKNRTFEAAIQSVLRQRGHEDELSVFVRALPVLRVDQKRRDAQMLIQHIVEKYGNVAATEHTTS